MSGVGLADGPDSKWYTDPADPDLVYERVSSILDATDGDAVHRLVPWSANTAARWAVEHLDEVQQAMADGGPEAAVKLIAGAAERERSIKREIGRHQHAVLEALILDTPIPDVPEYLDGVEVDGERADKVWQDEVSDGLLNFLTDFRVKPLLAEATVANVEHRFAGTLDVMAVFPTLRGLPWLPAGHDGATGIVDCKNGKWLKSRFRAQMAGYRRCDEVWGPLGQKFLMPPVDFTAVLHLRKTYRAGYKLIVTGRTLEHDAPAYDWFLRNLAALRASREQDGIKGDPLYPPGPDGLQPRPYLEDLDRKGLGACVKPLAAAGVHTVDDLAALTALAITRVNGIGRVRARLLDDLLKEYGLAWARTEGAA